MAGRSPHLCEQFLHAEFIALDAHAQELTDGRFVIDDQDPESRSAHDPALCFFRAGTVSNISSVFRRPAPKRSRITRSRMHFIRPSALSNAGCISFREELGAVFI